MADKKISALDPGAPAQLTDLLPAARGGANVSLMVVDILKTIYPVGSIYANVSDSTDPSVLFGFGTWAALGAGKFMVGLDAGDTDFDTPGETGGGKTSVSTGTVSQPTFTGNANQVTSSLSAGIPAGTVSQPSLVMDAYTPTGNCSVPVFTGNALTQHNHAVTATGNCSIPVFTGANLPVHNHSVTATGTCSIPVFTGAALGNHAHELPMQIVSNVLQRILPAATFGTGTSRAATANAAASVANVTNANVALSQAVSAGTPAGTINAPAFTGSAVASANSNTLTPAGTINAPAFTGSAVASANANAITPTGVINAPAFAGTANTLTGTVSQPTFTGNALANHNHTLTAAGTVSQPSYTGNAQSILPPYVVAYIWKRTA